MRHPAAICPAKTKPDWLAVENQQSSDLRAKTMSRSDKSKWRSFTAYYADSWPRRTRFVLREPAPASQYRPQQKVNCSSLVVGEVVADTTTCRREIFCESHEILQTSDTSSLTWVQIDVNLPHGDRGAAIYIAGPIAGLCREGECSPCGFVLVYFAVMRTASVSGNTGSWCRIVAMRPSARRTIRCAWFAMASSCVTITIVS